MRVKLEPRRFPVLTLAGVINAVGVTIFLAPVKLYDSGISGTSMLLGQVTPAWMSLSLFLLLLNFPLFLYGLRRMGPAFTVYSLYAVAVYSVTAWLITDVLPIDVATASPLAGQDLLLCSVFGGIISGVGSGLTIRYGGAIDGIEVMAVIFAKPLGLSVGTFVMGYNVVLYTLCGLTLRSWILPLYSIITYSAALKTVDFIVEGLDRSKSVMIITDHPRDVSRVLMESFGSGATILPARGGYSGREKAVIYFVVNRFQIPRLRTLVRETDPRSYVTVTDVADVIKAEL